MRIVTIAEANIFAKLFPTRIADKSLSGLVNNSNALLAPLFFFFDKFLSLTFLEAIIPVSDPEKKPDNINRNINIITKNNNEGSSNIKLLY